MNHHQDRTCEYCGKEYSSTSSLKYHIDTIHLNSRKVICTFCYERYASEANLRTHIDNVHNKGNLFSCQECKATFTIQKKLEDHMNLTHLNLLSDQSNKCERCDRHFSSAENLKLHLKFICKGINPQMNEVSENVKTYGQENTNKIDEVLVKNGKIKILGPSTNDFVVDKKYICEICAQSFHSRSSFREHMRNIHGQVMKRDIKNIKCPNCTECFFSGKRLEAHIKIHHKGLKIQCEHCGKCFSCYETLNYHVRFLHLKIQKSCEICQRKFRNNSEVQYHMDFAHKGVRYQCKICQKICGYSKELKRHLRGIHLFTDVDALDLKSYQIIDESKIDNCEMKMEMSWNDVESANAKVDFDTEDIEYENSDNFSDFSDDSDFKTVQENKDSTREATTEFENTDETFVCQKCNLIFKNERSS